MDRYLFLDFEALEINAWLYQNAVKD